MTAIVAVIYTTDAESEYNSQINHCISNLFTKIYCCQLINKSIKRKQNDLSNVVSVSIYVQDARFGHNIRFKAYCIRIK